MISKEFLDNTIKAYEKQVAIGNEYKRLYLYLLGELDDEGVIDINDYCEEVQIDGKCKKDMKCIDCLDKAIRFEEEMSRRKK